MEIRASVQQEINELQEYVKANQNKSFKTADLQTNKSAKSDTAEKIELSNAEEFKRYAFGEDNGVIIDLTDEGKTKANYMRRSSLAYINANAKEAARDDYSEEYGAPMEEASAGFKAAFSEQTIGKYADSGIKEDKIDLDYVDALNNLYQKLRDEVKTTYSGEEQKYRLSSLDKTYEKVFEKNIINPVISQYDGQSSFYQHGALQHSSDKQLTASYDTLKKGSDITDFLKNSANWADSSKVKENLKSLVDIVVSGAKSR